MKSVPIGKVAKFINGRAFKPSEWGTEGLPIIRIQNLTGSSQVVNYFSGEFDQKHLVKEGDILISWSASLGVYKWKGEDALLNQHIFKASIDDELVDRGYFYYAASSAVDDMIAQVHGTTMRHITKGPFEATEIPLPPLPEQQRIAAILGRADRLRRLRRTARELGDTYLQSVFLEMFGDPVTNPMGWKTGRLHRLCSQVVDCPHSTPEYAPNITEYACIRSSDIQNGFLDWSTTKYVDPEVHRERTERTVPIAGDVVYCREGARFGNAARIPRGRKVCLGQRMMLFRAAPDVATSEFIWAFLGSGSTYQQIVELSGGSASPHVNVGDIKALSAIIPPLPLQQQFAQIVHEFERLRAQQREAERQAEHLFQALLHQAFRREA